MHFRSILTPGECEAPNIEHKNICLFGAFLLRCDVAQSGYRVPPSLSNDVIKLLGGRVPVEENFYDPITFILVIVIVVMVLSQHKAILAMNLARQGGEVKKDNDRARDVERGGAWVNSLKTYKYPLE